MILYIDSSNGEKVVIKLNDQEIVSSALRDKSQLVLKLIVDSLNKKGLTLADIKKININRGPGSYTGLRVGLAVANTLGWALDVKVNGKNIKKDGPVLPQYE